MEVNYGALIGGIAVAASLLVFLVCFLLSGVGPRCCRLLAWGRLCRGGGAKPEAEGAGAVPTILQLRPPDIGAGVPTTSLCPVQLPAMVAKAKRSQPPPLYGSKSAPNPERPASPARGSRQLSPPATLPPPPPPPPPPLPQLTVADAWLLHGGVGGAGGGGIFGLSRTRRREDLACSRKTPGRAASQLSRSSPLLLLLPGGRRGLPGMQLSLSTIRDCSGSFPIPPDCLYAAAAESSESQYVGLGQQAPTADDTVASDAAAAAADAALSPSAAGTSLRAQIGSAYGPLPRLAPLPQSLPPPQPRSNASSSDCHDWSPPRPMPPAARGFGDGVGNGGAGCGGGGQYAVAPDAVFWASEDGDVAIFDLDVAAAATAAASATSAAASVAAMTQPRVYGPSSGSEERSTSF